MLSLFSLGVDPLQPEPLRAVAGSRCPSANPPKGLLYNHMSKTGGTTMKLLLTEAMGVKNSQGNVTLHHAESHIAGSDKSLGKDGALIFQDDTARDLQARPSTQPPTPSPDPSRALSSTCGKRPDRHAHNTRLAAPHAPPCLASVSSQTTSQDAASFFVLGVVRRPCDYLVSTWAWSSMLNRGKTSGTFLGKTPPYDNPEDQAAFASWMGEVISHRDAGEGWYSGSKFMSSALNSRYQDPNQVHCWVRTHSMTDDLKKCMAQYGSCGGTYSLEGLAADRMDEARSKANAAIKPTETAKCSTFFKNSSLMKDVMSSESSLISKYNLGSCCSS